MLLGRTARGSLRDEARKLKPAHASAQEADEARKLKPAQAHKIEAHTYAT